MIGPTLSWKNGLSSVGMVGLPVHGIRLESQPSSFPFSGPSTGSGRDGSGLLGSCKESYGFKEPAGAPRPVVTGKGHCCRFSPQNNDISRIKEKVKIFL